MNDQIQTIEQAPDQEAQQVDVQVIDNEPADATDAIRQSRSLIPVGPAGLSPTNFAQQVDFAKTMCQGKYGIPEHLRNNAGDCLAIIDIASRANLSPYMVASMTYVEPKNKKLAFMSQLYHAFLVQSRMLVGDLEVSYDGYGGGRTCTVSGRLRSDGKTRTHTSPPLKDLIPPKNEFGKIKGSPLWEKKPDVQQFYDTSRDWTRMFCPTATLGIFAPEEFVETPVDGESARDITPLKGRLGRATGDEGFQDGHAAVELSKIAPAGGAINEETKPPKKTQAKPAPANQGAAPARSAAAPAGKAKAAPAGRTSDRRKATPMTKGQVKAAADRAETRSAAANAPAAKPAKPAAPAPEPAKPKAKADLKTAADYIAYARAWVAASASHDEAMGRWEAERELRDKLRVAISDRNAITSAIDHKHGA